MTYYNEVLLCSHLCPMQSTGGRRMRRLQAVIAGTRQTISMYVAKSRCEESTS